MVKRYELQPEQQPGLDRQRSHGAAGDIEDAIYLTHDLIEKACKAGNVSLANGLLVTLSKLAKEHEQARIRQGQLLDARVAIAGARAICENFLAAIQPVVDDATFNNIVDAVLPGIPATLDRVRRQFQHTQLQLTDARGNDESAS